MPIRRLLLLIILSLSSPSVLADFGKITIVFNDQKVTLELAETFEQRAQGLMFRNNLCQECGMLFVFEEPRQVGFWMRNTFIPLDIAYLSANGEIRMIAPLVPLSEESVYSPDSIKYAWEMNRGWFNSKELIVGDKVNIIRAESN